MANVRVAVRVRPLSGKELDAGAENIININGSTLSITNVKVEGSAEYGDSSRDRVKHFAFDYCYDCSVDRGHCAAFASQQLVYQDLGTEVLQAACDGYNACLFAYGQTGTGKTFTMMGHPGEVGLTPRICEGLFGYVDECQEENSTFRVQISYMEIYNERVRDLLNSSSQPQRFTLRVREHPKEGPYVEDLSRHQVKDYHQVQTLLDRGNQNRTTAATHMHEHSSRSHAIVTLHFTQAKLEHGLPSEVVSKIHLVDLAGSERADPNYHANYKGRITEGGSINKSLNTLANVIKALAERSLLTWSSEAVGPTGSLGETPAGSSPSTGRKARVLHVPYRDSVLTWILKDSLGGNSKTLMIATVTPASTHYSDTLSTLRYAQRAKRIVNKPVINEDANVSLIRQLRQEIERLKQMLASATMCGSPVPVLEMTASLPGGDTDLPLSAHLGVDQGAVGMAEHVRGTLLCEKLKENEAMANQLTQSWLNKWTETQSLMKESDLSIRGLGGRSSSLGVVIDSQLPHLIGLHEDVLSTGVIIFHLKEGKTFVGREDARREQDIVLQGPGLQAEHCVIKHQDGQVTLHARHGAQCSLNGVMLNQPTALTQGDVLLLGKKNMFRFNNPAQAAKLRQHRQKQPEGQSLPPGPSVPPPPHPPLSATSAFPIFNPNVDLEQQYSSEAERIAEARRQLERVRAEVKEREEAGQEEEERLWAEHDRQRQELEQERAGLGDLRQRVLTARDTATHLALQHRSRLDEEHSLYKEQLQQQVERLIQTPAGHVSEDLTGSHDHQSACTEGPGDEGAGALPRSPPVVITGSDGQEIRQRRSSVEGKIRGLAHRELLQTFSHQQAVLALQQRVEEMEEEVVRGGREVEVRSQQVVTMERQFRADDAARLHTIRRQKEQLEELQRQEEQLELYVEEKQDLLAVGQARPRPLRGACSELSLLPRDTASLDIGKGTARAASEANIEQCLEADDVTSPHSSSSTGSQDDSSGPFYSSGFFSGSADGLGRSVSLDDCGLCGLGDRGHGGGSDLSVSFGSDMDCEETVSSSKNGSTPSSASQQSSTSQQSSASQQSNASQQSSDQRGVKDGGRGKMRSGHRKPGTLPQAQSHTKAVPTAEDKKLTARAAEVTSRLYQTRSAPCEPQRKAGRGRGNKLESVTVAHKSGSPHTSRKSPSPASRTMGKKSGVPVSDTAAKRRDRCREEWDRPWRRKPESESRGREGAVGRGTRTAPRDKNRESWDRPWRQGRAPADSGKPTRIPVPIAARSSPALKKGTSSTCSLRTAVADRSKPASAKPKHDTSGVKSGPVRKSSETGINRNSPSPDASSARVTSTARKSSSRERSSPGKPGRCDTQPLKTVVRSTKPKNRLKAHPSRGQPLSSSSEELRSSGSPPADRVRQPLGGSDSSLLIRRPSQLRHRSRSWLRLISSASSLPSVPEAAVESETEVEPAALASTPSMAELVAAVPRRQRRGRRALSEEEEERRHSEPVGDKWAEALAQYTADIESGLGGEGLHRKDVLSPASSQEWAADSHTSHPGHSVPEITVVEDSPACTDTDSLEYSEPESKADTYDQEDPEEVTPRPSDQSIPLPHTHCGTSSSAETNPSVDTSPLVTPRPADTQELEPCQQRESSAEVLPRQEWTGDESAERCREHALGLHNAHDSVLRGAAGMTAVSESQRLTDSDEPINGERKHSEGCFSTDSLDDSEHDPDSLSPDPQCLSLPADGADVTCHHLHTVTDLDSMGSGISYGFSQEGRRKLHLHETLHQRNVYEPFDPREEYKATVGDAQGSSPCSISTDYDDTCVNVCDYEDTCVNVCDYEDTCVNVCAVEQSQLVRADSLDDVTEDQLDSNTHPFGDDAEDRNSSDVRTGPHEQTLRSDRPSVGHHDSHPETKTKTTGVSNDSVQLGSISDLQEKEPSQYVSTMSFTLQKSSIPGDKPQLSSSAKIKPKATLARKTMPSTDTSKQSDYDEETAVPGRFSPESSQFEHVADTDADAKRAGPDSGSDMARQREALPAPVEGPSCDDGGRVKEREVGAVPVEMLTWLAEEEGSQLSDEALSSSRVKQQIQAWQEVLQQLSPRTSAATQGVSGTAAHGGTGGRRGKRRQHARAVKDSDSDHAEHFSDDSLASGVQSHPSSRPGSGSRRRRRPVNKPPDPTVKKCRGHSSEEYITSDNDSIFSDDSLTQSIERRESCPQVCDHKSSLQQPPSCLQGSETPTEVESDQHLEGTAMSENERTNLPVLVSHFECHLKQPGDNDLGEQTPRQREGELEQSPRSCASSDEGSGSASEATQTARGNVRMAKAAVSILCAGDENFAQSDGVMKGNRGTGNLHEESSSRTVSQRSGKLCVTPTDTWHSLSALGKNDTTPGEGRSETPPQRRSSKSGTCPAKRQRQDKLTDLHSKYGLMDELDHLSDENKIERLPTDTPAKNSQQQDDSLQLESCTHQKTQVSRADKKGKMRFEVTINKDETNVLYNVEKTEIKTYTLKDREGNLTEDSESVAVPDTININLTKTTTHQREKRCETVTKERILFPGREQVGGSEEDVIVMEHRFSGKHTLDFEQDTEGDCLSRECSVERRLTDEESASWVKITDSHNSSVAQTGASYEAPSDTPRDDRSQNELFMDHSEATADSELLSASGRVSSQLKTRKQDGSLHAEERKDNDRACVSVTTDVARTMVDCLPLTDATNKQLSVQRISSAKISAASQLLVDSSKSQNSVQNVSVAEISVAPQVLDNSPSVRKITTIRAALSETQTAGLTPERNIVTGEKTQEGSPQLVNRSDVPVSTVSRGTDSSSHLHQNGDESSGKRFTEACDEFSLTDYLADSARVNPSDGHVERGVSISRSAEPDRDVLQQNDKSAVEDRPPKGDDQPHTLADHTSRSVIYVPVPLHKSNMQRSEETAKAFQAETRTAENPYLDEVDFVFPGETVAAAVQQCTIADLSGGACKLVHEGQVNSSGDSFHEPVNMEIPVLAQHGNNSPSEKSVSQNGQKVNAARPSDTSTEYCTAALPEGPNSASSCETGAAPTFHSGQLFNPVSNSEQFGAQLSVRSDSSARTVNTDDTFYSPNSTAQSIDNSSGSSDYRTPQQSPRDISAKPSVSSASELIHHYQQPGPSLHVTRAEEIPGPESPSVAHGGQEGGGVDGDVSPTGVGQSSLLSAMAAAVGRRLLGDDGEMEAMREMLKLEVERKIARLQRRVRSLSDSAISSDFTEPESTTVSPRSSRIPVMEGKVEGVASDGTYYNASPPDDPQFMNERRKEMLLEKSLEDSGHIQDDCWQDTCTDIPEGGRVLCGSPMQRKAFSESVHSMPSHILRMRSVAQSTDHSQDLTTNNVTFQAEPSSHGDNPDVLAVPHEKIQMNNGLAQDRHCMPSPHEYDPRTLLHSTKSYDGSRSAVLRHTDLFSLPGHFPERVVDAVLSLEQAWSPLACTSKILSPRRRKGFLHRRTKSLNNLVELAAAQNRSDLEENLLEQARLIMQVARVPSGTDLTSSRRSFGDASGGESVFDHHGVAVDWVDGHFHPAKGIQASLVAHRPRAVHEGIYHAWLVSAENGVTEDAVMDSSVDNERPFMTQKQHEKFVVGSVSEHAERQTKKVGLSGLGGQQTQLASWISNMATDNAAPSQHSFQPGTSSVSSASSVIGSSTVPSLSTGEDEEDLQHHDQSSDKDSNSYLSSGEVDLSAVSDMAVTRKSNIELKSNRLNMAEAFTSHKGRHLDAGSPTRSSDTVSDQSSPRRWNFKECRKLRSHGNPTFRQERSFSPGELSLPEETVLWLQQARVGLREHETLDDLLQSDLCETLGSPELTAGQLRSLLCKSMSTSNLGQGGYANEEDGQEVSKWQMSRPASLACLEGIVVEAPTEDGEDMNSSSDSICFVFMDQRSPDTVAQLRALGGSFTTSEGSERVISHSQSTDSVHLCGHVERFMPPLSEHSASLNNIYGAISSKVQRKVQLHRSRSASLLDVGSTLVCEDELDENIFPPRVDGDSEISMDRVSNILVTDEPSSQETYCSSMSASTNVSKTVAASIQQVLAYSASSVDRSERHLSTPSPPQLFSTRWTAHTQKAVSLHQTSQEEMAQHRPGVAVKADSGQPCFRYKLPGTQPLNTESGAQTVTGFEDNHQTGATSPIKRPQSTGSLETLSSVSASGKSSSESRQQENRLPLSPKSKQWIELSSLMLETTHILHNIEQTLSHRPISRCSSEGSLAISDSPRTNLLTPADTQSIAIMPLQTQFLRQEVQEIPEAGTPARSLHSGQVLPQDRPSERVDLSLSGESNMSTVQVDNVLTQMGSSLEKLTTAYSEAHFVSMEASPRKELSTSEARPQMVEASSSVQSVHFSAGTCQTDEIEVGLHTKTQVKGAAIEDIESPNDVTSVKVSDLSDQRRRIQGISSNDTPSQTDECLIRMTNGSEAYARAVEITCQTDGPDTKSPDCRVVKNASCNKEGRDYVDDVCQTDDLSMKDITPVTAQSETDTAVDTHIPKLMKMTNLGAEVQNTAHSISQNEGVSTEDTETLNNQSTTEYVCQTDAVSTEGAMATKDKKTADSICQTESVPAENAMATEDQDAVQSICQTEGISTEDTSSSLRTDAGSHLEKHAVADTTRQTEEDSSYSAVLCMRDGSVSTKNDMHSSDFSCQTDETDTEFHVPRALTYQSSNTVSALGSPNFTNQTVDKDVECRVLIATRDTASSPVDDVRVSDCTCQTDETHADGLVSRVMTDTGCNTDGLDSGDMMCQTDEMTTENVRTMLKDASSSMEYVGVADIVRQTDNIPEVPEYPLTVAMSISCTVMSDGMCQTDDVQHHVHELTRDTTSSRVELQSTEMSCQTDEMHCERRVHQLSWEGSNQVQDASVSCTISQTDRNLTVNSTPEFSEELGTGEEITSQKNNVIQNRSDERDHGSKFYPVRVIDSSMDPDVTAQSSEREMKTFTGNTQTSVTPPTSQSDRTTDSIMTNTIGDTENTSTSYTVSQRDEAADGKEMRDSSCSPINPFTSDQAIETDQDTDQNPSVNRWVQILDTASHTDPCHAPEEVMFVAQKAGVVKITADRLQRSEVTSQTETYPEERTAVKDTRNASSSMESLQTFEQTSQTEFVVRNKTRDAINNVETDVCESTCQTDTDTARNESTPLYREIKDTESGVADDSRGLTEGFCQTDESYTQWNGLQERELSFPAEGKTSADMPSQTNENADDLRIKQMHNADCQTLNTSFNDAVCQTDNEPLSKNDGIVNAEMGKESQGLSTFPTIMPSQAERSSEIQTSSQKVVMDDSVCQTESFLEPGLHNALSESVTDQDNKRVVSVTCQTEEAFQTISTDITSENDQNRFLSFETPDTEANMSQADGHEMNALDSMAEESWCTPETSVDEVNGYVALSTTLPLCKQVSVSTQLLEDYPSVYIAVHENYTTDSEDSNSLTSQGLSPRHGNLQECVDKEEDPSADGDISDHLPVVTLEDDDRGYVPIPTTNMAQHMDPCGPYSKGLNIRSSDTQHYTVQAGDSEMMPSEHTLEVQLPMLYRQISPGPEIAETESFPLGQQLCSYDAPLQEHITEGEQGEFVQKPSQNKEAGGQDSVGAHLAPVGHQASPDRLLSDQENHGKKQTQPAQNEPMHTETGLPQKQQDPEYQRGELCFANGENSDEQIDSSNDSGNSVTVKWDQQQNVDYDSASISTLLLQDTSGEGLMLAGDERDQQDTEICQSLSGEQTVWTPAASAFTDSQSQSGTARSDSCSSPRQTQHEEASESVTSLRRKRHPIDETLPNRQIPEGSPRLPEKKTAKTTDSATVRSKDDEEFTLVDEELSVDEKTGCDEKRSTRSEHTEAGTKSIVGQISSFTAICNYSSASGESNTVASTETNEESSALPKTPEGEVVTRSTTSTDMREKSSTLSQTPEREVVSESAASTELEERRSTLSHTSGQEVVSPSDVLLASSSQAGPTPSHLLDGQPAEHNPLSLPESPSSQDMINEVDDFRETSQQTSFQTVVEKTVNSVSVVETAPPQHLASSLDPLSHVVSPAQQSSLGESANEEIHLNLRDLEVSGDDSLPGLTNHQQDPLVTLQCKAEDDPSHETSPVNTNWVMSGPGVFLDSPNNDTLVSDHMTDSVPVNHIESRPVDPVSSNVTGPDMSSINVLPHTDASLLYLGRSIISQQKESDNIPSASGKHTEEYEESTSCERHDTEFANIETADKDNLGENTQKEKQISDLSSPSVNSPRLEDEAEDQRDMERNTELNSDDYYVAAKRQGHAVDSVTEDSNSDTDEGTEGEVSFRPDEKLEETRDIIRPLHVMAAECGPSITAYTTSLYKANTDHSNPADQGDSHTESSTDQSIHADQDYSYNDFADRSQSSRYNQRQRRDSDNAGNKEGELSFKRDEKTDESPDVIRPDNTRTVESGPTSVTGPSGKASLGETISTEQDRSDSEFPNKSRSKDFGIEFERHTDTDEDVEGELSFKRDETMEESRDVINPIRVMSLERGPIITVRPTSPLETDPDQVVTAEEDYGTDESAGRASKPQTGCEGQLSYYRYDTEQERPCAQLSVLTSGNEGQLRVSTESADDILSSNSQPRWWPAGSEQMSLTTSDEGTDRTTSDTATDRQNSDTSGPPHGTSQSDVMNEIEKLRQEHKQMMLLLERSRHRSSPLLNRLHRARSASPCLMHGGSWSSSSGSPVTVIAGIGSVRGSPVTFTTTQSPRFPVSGLLTGSVEESGPRSGETAFLDSGLKRHSIATTTAEDSLDATVPGEWLPVLAPPTLYGILTTSSTPDLRSETRQSEEAVEFSVAASSSSGTVIRPLAVYGNRGNFSSQREESLSVSEPSIEESVIDRKPPKHTSKNVKAQLPNVQTSMQEDQTHRSGTVFDELRQNHSEHQSQADVNPSADGNQSDRSLESSCVVSCEWMDSLLDTSQAVEWSQPPLDTRNNTLMAGAQPSYSTARTDGQTNANTVASPRSDFHQLHHQSDETFSDLHESFADGEMTPDYLIQTPRSIGGDNVPPLDHQLVAFSSLISKGVEAVVNSSDEITQTDAEDDSLYLSQLDVSQVSITSDPNSETHRIRAELDRLHQERVEIIELLSLKYLPGSLTVELLEAKLNYCLGQTDMLLASLEKAWEQDEAYDFSRHHSKKHEELSEYRLQFEQSRQDIKVCMEEARRTQHGTRGRRVARTRDVIAMKRRAEIEAFKQERRREQDWYNRHRTISPDISDCNSDAGSSRAFAPRFMTPRQHKEHLVRLRRSVVAASTEELNRLRRLSQSSSISPSPDRSFSPVSSLSNTHRSRESSLGSSMSPDRHPTFSPDGHPTSTGMNCTVSVSFSTPSLNTPAAYSSSTLQSSIACSTPSLHLSSSPQRTSRHLAPPEPMHYRGGSIPRHPKSYLASRSSSCGPAMSRRTLTTNLLAPPLSYQEHQHEAPPVSGSTESLDPEQLLQESYTARQLNRQQIVKAQEALRLLEEHRHGFHSQIRSQERRRPRHSARRLDHRAVDSVTTHRTAAFSEQVIQQEIANLRQQRLQSPGGSTGLDSGVMSLSLQESVNSNIPPESTSTPRSSENFAVYVQDRVVVREERHIQTLVAHPGPSVEAPHGHEVSFDRSEVSTSDTPSSLQSTDLESFLDLSTSPTQAPQFATSRPISSRDIKARIAGRVKEKGKGKK
ncbi:uncharacterized protein LOC143296707 isoform X2 [Babylonia areolata]|uniref:uncharacterized protein LOC143296707 isoform X2 n=1 Tax=Babylonia areolata TaxID=304850 RepID=UPI003FD20E36